MFNRFALFSKRFFFIRLFFKSCTICSSRLTITYPLIIFYNRDWILHTLIGLGDSCFIASLFYYIAQHTAPRTLEKVLKTLSFTSFGHSFNIPSAFQHAVRRRSSVTSSFRAQNVFQFCPCNPCNACPNRVIGLVKMEQSDAFPMTKEKLLSGNSIKVQTNTVRQVCL